MQLILSINIKHLFLCIYYYAIQLHEKLRITFNCYLLVHKTLVNNTVYTCRHV